MTFVHIDLHCKIFAKPIRTSMQRNLGWHLCQPSKCTISLHVFDIVSWFGWVTVISRFLQSTEKFIVWRKRSAFTSGERGTVLHNSMLGTLSNPKNIWRVLEADLCTRHVFLKGKGISTPGFGRVSTRRYSPWWPHLVPSQQRFQGFKRTPLIGSPAYSLWKPLSLLSSQVGDDRRFS